MIARALHLLFLRLHWHKWRPVRFHNGQYLHKCERCGAWK